MVNIWDPHFHIWDVSEVTQSGHDPAQLFAPKEDPVYTIDRYENDMAMEGFKLTGGVFVEAVSVCHVESDGPFFVVLISSVDFYSNCEIAVRKLLFCEIFMRGKMFFSPYGLMFQSFSGWTFYVFGCSRK